MGGQKNETKNDEDDDVVNVVVVGWVMMGLSSQRHRHRWKDDNDDEVVVVLMMKWPWPFVDDDDDSRESPLEDWSRWRAGGQIDLLLRRNIFFDLPFNKYKRTRGETAPFAISSQEGDVSRRRLDFAA